MGKRRVSTIVLNALLIFSICFVCFPISKALAKDQATKDVLQKEIDGVEAAITANRAELKPVVEYMVSPSFGSSAEADDWMKKVEADAKAARDKAAKEAENKKG